MRGRRSGALFDSDLTVRHRIPTVTAERALIDVSSRADGGSARPCARRRDPPEAHRPRGVPPVCAAACCPRRDVPCRRCMPCWARGSPATTRATATSRPERCAHSPRPGSRRPSSSTAWSCAVRRSRIDLAYPELKIAIELDSWKYHGGDNLHGVHRRPSEEERPHRARLGRAQLHRVDDRRVLRLSRSGSCTMRRLRARASHSRSGAQTVSGRALGPPPSTSMRWPVM